MEREDGLAAAAPAMTPPVTPFVPVSWGELLDKITILEIKMSSLPTARARVAAEHEYGHLSPIARSGIDGNPEIAAMVQDLKQVNRALWAIEEELRAKERAQVFDQGFVELARSVYRLNDRRAAIKRQINLELASEFTEEKSYQDD